MKLYKYIQIEFRLHGNLQIGAPTQISMMQWY